MFLRYTDEQEVISTIKSLRPGHSAGLDEISSSLLRDLADQLASPLTHIVNSSFDSGEFPSAFKRAVVKPLLKRGDPLKVQNYRPISILSTFSKVLEKLFLNRLQSFLMINDILFSKQFGFRKNSSTLDAVFSFISNVVQALDKKEHCFGIFLDLSKAFDVVNHDLLLYKVQKLGIRGHGLKWLTSFLTGRSQVVEVPFLDNSGGLCSQFSSPLNVNTGVPQGSVLGPLLFLLFINDISHSVSCGNICLFADDTSLNLSNKSRGHLEIETFIQSSALLQWLEENNLDVNKSKTKFIDFHLKRSESLDYTSSYIFMGDSEIRSSECTNFLGLLIDSNLSYHLHIDKICKKMSSGIFILRRLSHFANRDILLAAYYGCIYPHITYCLPIWGAESTRTQYLFRLQKKAVRIIMGLNRSQSCRGLFRSANLLTFPSLYILEASFFLKRNLHVLFPISQPKCNLRDVSRLPIPKHRTTFFERQVVGNSTKIFNHLPSRLRGEPSLKLFRSKLKAFLLAKEYYSVNCFLMDRDID